MQTFKNEEIYIKNDNFSDMLFDESSLFFDIETTGFSPTKACVYMIGCAYRSANALHIVQFFAEGPDEESEIIKEFLALSCNYKKLITFNGIGFDVPFLKAKAIKYDIDTDWSKYDYLDIFKEITPIKPLLSLENYKQKTIEKFLGLIREDKYSGGDLIAVYNDFVYSKNDELIELLRLHNYEDVLGMTQLLPILSYTQLLKSSFTPQRVEVTPYTSYDGSPKKELVIYCRCDFSVPNPIMVRKDNFYLRLKQDKLSVRTDIYEGKLKYFYDNYKDYFYLPNEDTAIHKSVAAYVDKEYKEKCKANNCYIKKSGSFIIQYSAVMKPEFREDHKDKHSYFKLTEDFCNSEEMLKKYTMHIIKHLLS